MEVAGSYSLKTMPDVHLEVRPDSQHIVITNNVNDVEYVLYPVEFEKSSRNLLLQNQCRACGLLFLHLAGPTAMLIKPFT